MWVYITIQIVSHYYTLLYKLFYITIDVTTYYTLLYITLQIVLQVWAWDHFGQECDTHRNNLLAAHNKLFCDTLNGWSPLQPQENGTAMIAVGLQRQ